MSNYSSQLRDPRWQKKRLEIMERDKYTCQLCGNTEKTLNVHHLYYAKGINIWDYDSDTLITVCEECHTTHAKHFAFESAKALYRNIKMNAGNADKILGTILAPAQDAALSHYKSISFNRDLLETCDVQNIEHIAFVFGCLPPPWTSKLLTTLRHIADWALQSNFYEMDDSQKVTEE